MYAIPLAIVTVHISNDKHHSIPRFLVYALPCAVVAVVINIPKFFEVQLVYRYVHCHALLL